MIIVTSRNDQWTTFKDLAYGLIFVNANQDYCIRIPDVKDSEFEDVTFNTVNLGNGELSYTNEWTNVVPLPKSELHIEF